jgi:thioredoxin-related protein
MKYLYMLVILLVTLTAHAQGINFERDLSWTEVQAKAKASGKAIFVDCYTTWCGPCKQMDKDVFPKKETGDFFNRHFISFKLQMDKTPADVPAIKKQYADAEWFERNYQITAYPCYLFFDSNGKLIHQAGGGGLKVADFIAIGQEALDPGKQLMSFKKKYNQGLRDTEFMKTYIYKLAAARDPLLEQIADEFLKSQKDPFSAESVGIMMFMTTGSDSKYFDLLIKNKHKLYTSIGKAKADIYFKKVIDAGITSKGLKIDVDKDTHKQKYRVDERALLQYFSRFYSADTSVFLAGFHTASISKMIDEQQACLKAKTLLNHSVKPDLQQAALLSLMIVGKGTNQEDNKLALSLLSAYPDTEDHLMNQTRCKVYSYSGQPEKALEYAAKALASIRKTRSNYPDITVQEYLNKALTVNSTPKIISN